MNLKPSGQRGPLLLRLSVALVVGCLVAFLSLLAVWADMRNVKPLRREQWETRQRLGLLTSDIEYYRELGGALPESMTDLKDTRYLVDGWGRAFTYTRSGTNWTVRSYGRDGKKGGTGADADSTNWEPESAESRQLPSLYEFALEMELTRTATISTVVCGILAGLLTVFTIRIPALTRRDIVQSAWVLVATLVGATFIAFMIAGLEVPHH